MIPPEACDLGWQESLTLLAQRVGRRFLTDTRPKAGPLR
jgi:hypothetical protein